jgi:hypothetical protein
LYEVKTVVEVRVSKNDLVLFIFIGISLYDVPISPPCCNFEKAQRLFSTYVVASLLIFISLLVLSSLGLIWSALLLIQCLPSLTEDLADLTCESYASAAAGRIFTKIDHTEADARVLITDVLTLLVGEEHVRREATLGRVGV